ncbi:MAG: 50S ribosomal protein L25/general stress protein Ctc [Solitalea-like symbiont of Tyrophagus putrescentiae]
MKSINLKGDTRPTGKKATKQLRYKGYIPCVLYGSGEQDNIHFSVFRNDVRNIVYTRESQFVDIEVDNKTVRAIVKEIQFHPVNELILHMDFLAINENKPITVNLPIDLVGNAPGVMIGGKLNQKLRSLKVKALPKDMPDSIQVDINELELGKNIRVRDVKLDKVEIINPGIDTIVSVLASRVTRQAAAEASKK